MVQSHTLKGNTFQVSSMTRSTHNNLLEQELRRIQQLAGFREVLSCSEPCRNFFKLSKKCEGFRVFLTLSIIGSQNLIGLVEEHLDSQFGEDAVKR